MRNSCVQVPLFIQLFAITNVVLAHHDNEAHKRYIASFSSPFSATSMTSYTHYKGDGTAADGWPNQTDWLDFDNMWNTNRVTLIDKICDNSDDETEDLSKAINNVAEDTEVDARFILAVVMEESRGCVRVGSTKLSVVNPGLMQSYKGKGSCVGKKPCPYSEILQMINDGTAPNKAGVDLSDLLAFSNCTDTSEYYKAARMYNSGKLSIGKDGDLSADGANACYASDIANRLKGYVGDSCGNAK